MKKNKQRSENQNMLGSVIGMGVTNLVGTSLISATAGMVNQLPAGTARDIAGITPGLQGVALMGANLGMVKKTMKSSKGNSYW